MIFYHFERVNFDFLAIEHTERYVSELKIKRYRSKFKTSRGDF